MKVYKNSLTQLASEGYITLQVPELDIEIENGQAFAIDSAHAPDNKLEEIPNEWIMKCNGDCLAAGREEGFSYVSPAGWKANKDKIKAAFEASPNKRGTWQEFEAHAQDFFAKIKKKSAAKAIKLHQKASALQTALKILE